MARSPRPWARCARKTAIPSRGALSYWNIGNEPWGAWQIGRTDLKYFMQKHNDFAEAMRKVDPSIVLIASGEMLEDGQVPARSALEIRWQPGRRLRQRLRLDRQLPEGLLGQL